jgi:signal transduction histidine kinase/CheY-like chemotaxis protein
MLARLLWLRERRWIGFTSAVLLCLVALGFRLAFHHVFPAAPFLTFLPAIIISTLVGGASAGIAAVVLTALLVNQFILVPADFNLFWPNGWIMLLAFTLITGTMVVLVNISVRTSLSLARASAELRAINAGLETRIAERTAALMQAEEKLRQAQKMEAVGQLTGGIAHDFNNLLTSINGSLEMLQNRVAQGRLDDLGRYVAAARESASRAGALTHRLLAFARQQTLAPASVDVNALIAGLENLISRSIGPGILVRVEAAAAPATVRVDPNQLEHALLNLCINASDAMPDGGELVISTAGPDDGLVALCVRDTGTGMGAEVIERAFEPFFTTKPLGQGTGLGLSMIYGFARQSGGEVRIESQPGAGTAVTMVLPECKAAAAPAHPQEAAVAPMESAKQVLVVDDEPSLRMLVTEVLVDIGCTALQAADGAAGLREIEGPQAIDLMVTDVGLPGGMNGRQLAEAARRLRPELKILFITGYAEGALMKQGFLPAGMQVLTKPFSLEALAAKVQSLLAV